MQKINVFSMAIAVLLVLFPQDAAANSFLTSATSWIECRGHETNGRYQVSNVSIARHYVSGDTIINGQAYKCIDISVYHTEVSENEDGSISKHVDTTSRKSAYFMREEDDGSIWLLIKDKQMLISLSGNDMYEQIGDELVNKDLFLFNVKKTFSIGEKLPIGASMLSLTDIKDEKNPSPWVVCTPKITGVATVVMEDGVEHEVYGLGEYGPGFVSGMGPLDGPLSGLGQPNSTYQRILLAFCRGNQMIYGDMAYVKAIEEQFPNLFEQLMTTGSSYTSITSAPASHPSPLHDLQGRQLQHEPVRGVFIKDGRKWVK